MAIKFYDLDPKEIESLKDAFYDVESYKVIMPEIMKILPCNEQDYSTYNIFREEYKKALIRYDTEKINFEFNYVQMKHPNAISWNVTFGDNKVKIEYQD